MASCGRDVPVWRARQHPRLPGRKGGWRQLGYGRIDPVGGRRGRRSDLGGILDGRQPKVYVPGGVDEVAIYRRALPVRRIAARFKKAARPPRKLAAELAALPAGRVRVAVYGGVSEAPWDLEERPAPWAEFSEPAFAVTEMPQYYSAGGLRDECPNPCWCEPLARNISLQDVTRF